jgi:hypothetical protein
MRGREPVREFSVLEHLAKEFAKFLNRVQNDQVDILGSFLIENEWDKYVTDAKEVVQSLELGGFAVVPKNPTEAMIMAADRTLAGGLMGQRGARAYVVQVFEAMVDGWLATRNSNLIYDIFSMALARASNPKARRDSSMYDAGFQRFRKQSQDMLASLQKAGQVVVPDEPTPEMIASGVAETPEIRNKTNSNIGADPTYLASLYENMLSARPK